MRRYSSCLAALAARLQKSKPEFAQRHQKLLAERYDLADRPAASAAMSRGKPLLKLNGQEKKDLLAFMRAL